MLKETNNLILDYINLTDSWENPHYLRPEEGCEISIKYKDSIVKITRIVWNYHIACPEIHTYDTKLQDCITSWELYKEFIELVDEAYYRVDLAIASKKLHDYCE